MCGANQKNVVKYGGVEMIEDRLEVERIQNLVRNFGWELSETKSTDANLVIVLEKKREKPEASGVGAD